jgi:hypothetical protein
LWGEGSIKSLVKLGDELMKSVSRKEDMSIRGQLRILLDEEGDIHVAVYEDDGEGIIYNSASVEFCSGLGGGQSRHTREALYNLMEAMQLDNQEYPFRAGDLP